MAGSAEAAVHAAQFGVLSYNILARSLGSNAIPWVMSVAPELRRRVEAATGQPWDAWKKEKVQPEYVTHFHKNFASGNYAVMRGLWAAPRCSVAADIPAELTGVTVQAEDTVTYAPPDAVCVRVGRLSARTLRGVLRDALPGGLGAEVFDAVRAAEDSVYAWRARGPRVWRAVTRRRGELGGAAPDIVALQEYDIHDATTVYRLRAGTNVSVAADFVPGVDGAVELRRGLGGRVVDTDDDGNASVQFDGADGPCLIPVADFGHLAPDPADGRETFAAAMAAAGFRGVFFKDPLRGRTPPSGLALWWRDAVFEPAPPDAGAVPVASRAAPAGARQWACDCGETAAGGAAVNVDLDEHWHPARGGVAAGHRERMRDADRRNTGWVRLRHRASGAILWAATAHLMTTSRDSARTNAFPGEVRAGELAALRLAASRLVYPREALLLCGDFNTSPGEAHVFAGRVPAAGGAAAAAPAPITSRALLDGEMRAETGGGDGGELRWADAAGGALPLREAFADQHRWEAGAGGGYTSRNADRSEWIDYVWYAAGRLRAVRADVGTTPGAIPDADNPSDHLPITAVVALAGAAGCPAGGPR